MSQILPRQSRREGEFVPPADRLISSLDGVFYKLSEVSLLVGKSEVTLRRLMKRNVLAAPSFQVDQGKNTYYLYTPADVQEIKDHYANESVIRKRHATSNQDQQARGLQQD